MPNSMQWQGVMPAITTPFNDDLTVDYEFLAWHGKWLVDQGCTGLVPLGSLGEGATLTFEEKERVLTTLVRAVDKRVPVVAGISALTTSDAVALAQMAERSGCSGLMVLPPYVYAGDWPEMKAHVSAVIGATSLSCMLYNNPIAYRTDFLPEQVCELLACWENLHAIKESSADVRRVAALRALAGERLEICCGVDDVIVEAIHAGARCWIAGLANAFPRESVELFQRAASSHPDTFSLYKWFLPMLRMDTVPKFVQLIKLAQQEARNGNERVRPPRLPLAGVERDEALAIVRTALGTRT